jgi:hypothetical protein
MKGTIISILVGALAGVLLTVGPALRGSRVGANHAAQVGGLAAPVVAADVGSRPASHSAARTEQATLAK